MKEEDICKDCSVKFDGECENCNPTHEVSKGGRYCSVPSNMTKTQENGTIPSKELHETSTHADTDGRGLGKSDGKGQQETRAPSVEESEAVGSERTIGLHEPLWTAEDKLKEIFQTHNLIMFDNTDYGGKRINIPEELIVSHKWLARILDKKFIDADAFYNALFMCTRADGRLSTEELKRELGLSEEGKE